MADEKAVLFVDMLGFSNLTEQCSIEEEDFAELDRPNPKDFLRVRFEAVGENKLLEHYTKFSMAVEAAVDWELRSDKQLTAITFSDSAFIAVESVHTAISMGKSIMTQLIRERIPIRVGVAYGSFLVLRFRSDLSLRAGTHAAQFVGTGVVWSHAAAEASGIKGMRLLVHKSAAERVNDGEFVPQAPQLAHRIVELAPTEQTNKVSVVFEISHLNSGPNHSDGELWAHIQAMRDDSPEGAWPHYVATLDSITRMRAQLGREPLPS